MKSYLFVLQTAAFSGAKVQEVLDQVLIAAAFDQRVSLLLLDDAFFHLSNNQRSEQLASKDISAIFRSLHIYNIEHIFVEQESLARHGLLQDQLIVPITILSRQDVGATLSAFDVVLSA
ncbi:tRNA 2-thiouridine synthesizing protein C [Bathymodiolus japonicus methanotrophic gill symbiont]|uniref:sulfurtransferase complex subunit TusC n=1 Tax=Bathymodiolus japonicus methanotrophic gill symbiont TaxID=113269 RepID=UPI001B3DFF26|nr:sulfurtransferase complex subunit TusC [Bathymodiolus japonicus methanotrophic gill symbiont]GFO71091.1 tRNA 2-thiouridine synthesizing protein C [Bathymodiolus japonicus methanotrophic gill symbiont]